MNLPKPVGFALRALITIGATYLALSQVALGEITPLLAAIPFGIILIALMFTHAAQLFGALRTRYYLHCHGIYVPKSAAIRLHYVGGLFNAFLPGGAGGDAYKVWWLTRHKQGALLSMAKLMIAGRLNGLCALGMFGCALSFFSLPVRSILPGGVWLILGVLMAGVAGYAMFARILFKELFNQQRVALLYSLALQFMLVLAAYVLALGLGQEANALEYVILFMLSCILAMLPISIGGIGVRELALLHGSRLLHLSEDMGVTLAFAFTLLSLSVPIIGAFIHTFHASHGEQATHDA